MALPYSTASTVRQPRHGRGFLSRRSSSFFLGVLLALTLVLLVLLALGIFSVPVDSVPPNLHGVDRVELDRDRDGLGRRGQQWTEILSWEPRAFLYHNFLSKEECEYLIELAKPRLRKSTVVDSETGKSKDSRVRTSSGMFLNRGRDKIIRAIEKRIADFAFIPVDLRLKKVVRRYFPMPKQIVVHYHIIMSSQNVARKVWL